MLVFLSWSGSRSKAVAKALQGWLKKVIQAVDPWISVEIEKGKRWTPEISDRLGQSNVGVFCLTKDNLNSPWLLFEAGAISKNKEGTVCTFLLDLTPGDLENPLAQFQATIAEKEDTFRLVQSINQEVQEVQEKWLPEGDLKESFEAWWPRLEEQLKSIKAQAPASPKPLRDQREMLEEVLELLRGQAREEEARRHDALFRAFQNTSQHSGGANVSSGRDSSIDPQQRLREFLNVGQGLRAALGKDEKLPDSSGAPDGDKAKKD